jgi:hypothetical protein
MNSPRAGLNLTAGRLFRLAAVSLAGITVYLGYQLLFAGVDGQMSQSIESKAA